MDMEPKTLASGSAEWNARAAMTKVADELARIGIGMVELTRGNGSGAVERLSEEVGGRGSLELVREEQVEKGEEGGQSGEA